MKKENEFNILLVEDSPSLGAVYCSYLKGQPYNVTHVETGQEALDYLATNVPSAVLLDLQLPDMPGMEILKHVTSHEIPTAVVIITANGSAEIAVESMRHGAFDFISKPFDAKRLIVTVQNVLKQQELNQIVENYKASFSRERYHNFIGHSLAMQTVYRIVDSAAPSKATVFITGESGTGKELCAEAVHLESPRKKNEFIALNCAAIPRDLIESEIFGHVKGAFTGANAERKGAASLADGGTLFLDEICEMDLDLQSKLLRFIQTGEFQKVGSSKAEKVDVRFVCATNRDPLLEVKEGRFREDLYYRLHVIPISLPPLRERDDDVIAISREFLTNYAKEESKPFEKFSPEVENIIRGYNWPGNIRQLQNVVRNIVVLNQGGVITPDMLPPPLNHEMPDIKPSPRLIFANPDINTSNQPQQASTTDNNSSASLASANSVYEIKPLWQVEKEAIDQAIELCDGNIPKAAAMLEVSPSTIYRKIQAWKQEGNVNSVK